jgi:hypothetical protein
MDMPLDYVEGGYTYEDNNLGYLLVFQWIGVSFECCDWWSNNLLHNYHWSYAHLEL